MGAQGTQLLRWTRRTDSRRSYIRTQTPQASQGFCKERSMTMPVAEQELASSSRKEQKMYTIHIDALCSDCNSPQLLGQATVREGMLESMLGLILLDFCGAVIIHEVKVQFEPASGNQPSHCRLEITATCSHEIAGIPLDLLQVRLEQAISCELLSHFETVVINAVDIERVEPGQ
jgi:hypothetical protein